jgi:hypothetical protein
VKSAAAHFHPLKCSNGTSWSQNAGRQKHNRLFMKHPCHHEKSHEFEKRFVLGTLQCQKKKTSYD